MRTPVAGTASVAQVAQQLHERPGFAYLHAGPGGPSLFAEPLVTVRYADRRAAVRGPGGEEILEAPAFEILEAILQTWGGSSGAVLAGYLSYDLAAELEDVGPLPPSEFDFPQFWFGLYESWLTRGLTRDAEDNGWCDGACRVGH